MTRTNSILIAIITSLSLVHDNPVFGADDTALPIGGSGTRLLESVNGGTLIRMLVEASNLGSTAIEVGEITFAPGSASGGHAHASLELFYVTSGALLHEVDGKQLLLKPGMIGIVRSGEQVVHRVPGKEPCRALVIWVPGGEAERLSDYFVSKPI